MNNSDANKQQNPLQLTGHNPVLDGLRGLAIFLVLLRHLTPLGEGHSLIGKVVKAIASVGNTGVDLFFVLSGFLITGILSRPKDHRAFSEIFMPAGHCEFFRCIMPCYFSASLSRRCSIRFQARKVKSLIGSSGSGFTELISANVI